MNSSTRPVRQVTVKRMKWKVRVGKRRRRRRRRTRRQTKAEERGKKIGEQKGKEKKRLRMEMCKRLIRWTDIQCMFYPQPFYKYKHPLPFPPFSHPSPSPVISILLLFSREADLSLSLSLSLSDRHTCPYTVQFRDVPFNRMRCLSLLFILVLSSAANQPQSCHPSRYLAIKFFYFACKKRKRKKKERKEEGKKERKKERKS